MAHVSDRWTKLEDGERTRTERWGRGKRWRVRYRDPDHRERAKDFAKKTDADRFVNEIEVDKPATHG